jgi:hypothetical protein
MMARIFIIAAIEAISLLDGGCGGGRVLQED